MGTRLTALGFALGGLVHVIAFVLLYRGIELYGRDYPAWRHLVMAAIDGGIVYIAAAHTPFLAFALLAFGVEQLLVNGVGAVAILVFVAAFVVSWERRSAH